MVIGYDLTAWNSYLHKMPIRVDVNKQPSCLIVGASGSGKSYSLIYMLKNLVEEVRGNIKLYFCDFKNSDDFAFLSGYKHYYTYMDCKAGLDAFHAAFTDAQNSNSENMDLNILVFDEYAAFIYRLEAEDKKVAAHYKGIISDLLMLGRSRSFGIWILAQRPDAALFHAGSRANFFIRILYGSSTMEARRMVVSDAELPKGQVYRQGEGICWIDGKGLVEIKIPRIKDLDAYKRSILQRLVL
ncbi:ATP-binding protein [Lachnospiraceae bacterium OttesenSCG-928-D06]|nr:ATP-binding protein [Lachnospiraceae bacterium OttesenSCG-928-D06]